MTYYWEEHGAGDERWQAPPGADLAAMRAGLSREPGDIPGMWPMYRSLPEDGRLTNQLRAEHATLSLYGLHQQGQHYSVHAEGISIASAFRLLRESDRFSVDAVDARFTGAAASSDLDSLTFHLRGLINQLKSIERRAPFDYTQLLRDLTRWQQPANQAHIRRIWASKYFTRRTASKEK